MSSPLIRKGISPLALTIAMINSGFAAGVYAQTDKDTKETSAGQLEEVIVTATKRETNLMDTPIAITVFSQADLDREGIANVKDLSKMVPNMDITLESSRSAPVISMRGVRSTNNTELGDPAVGLHLDGIYSPRPQGAMALMFDVERIEAQRGPQGTLFGRNSTVGNINIISKRPDAKEFDASVGVEAGRWNHQQVRGMINIPVAETFALRASFMTEKRDSYLDGYYDPNQWDQRYLPDNVKNAPAYSGAADDRTRVQSKRWWGGAQEVVKADPSSFYNNSDQYAFRVAGYWTPSDNFSWQLAYERFQNDSAGSSDSIDCSKARKMTIMNGDTPAPLQGCENVYGKGADEYTLLVNMPGMVDQTIENIRSNIRWDFSDSLALVYNAGWAEQTQSQMSDLDSGITDWDMSMFFNGATFKSQSHEMQIQSTGDSKLQWITGLFYFEENNNMQGGMTHSMMFGEYWNQSDRTLESKAAFAQGTYDLTDDLALTVGYRYTEDTKQDVGGHGAQCWDWHANQDDTSANGGRCFPAWDHGTFNSLPKDYFLNKDIYRINADNDNYGEWSYNNYRLGLDYDISEETMVFGYVANGNKGGGIGDVIVQTKQDPLTADYVLDENGNAVIEKRWQLTYDEEEVVTWETGVKTDLFDKSLRLMATLFYSEYTDMQVSNVKPLFVTYAKEKDPQTGIETGNITTNAAYSTVTDNIGKAEIKGLEVEFDWAMSENDRLRGHFTYLDTEIVSDFVQQWAFAATDLYKIDQAASVDPTNTLIRANLKGNELPSSPKFSINVNYSHDFNLSYGALIQPWIGVNWRDDSYYSYFNVDKHTEKFVTDTPEAFSDTRPAVTYVNLGIKYVAPDDKWNIEAFVNNATDEVDFYWASGGDGLIKGPVSMPRFYGIRANYNF